MQALTRRSRMHTASGLFSPQMDARKIRQSILRWAPKRNQTWPDWTAENLAREIERRRGRDGRRGALRTRTAEDHMLDWSDADWTKAFELRHGSNADPGGRVPVREMARTARCCSTATSMCFI